MSLDFTALDNIQLKRVIQDFSEPLEPVAGNLALEPEKHATEGNIRPTGHTHSHRLDAEKRERERIREVYSTYQDNIKKAGNCRSEILKGIKRGEDPLALLLKAVECISLMTGDTAIYPQAKGDITAIYGWGLGYATPLSIQLKEAKERLERLEQVEARPEEALRLENSIREHRQLITTLQERLERAESKDTPKPVEDILEGVIEDIRTKQYTGHTT